MNYTDWEVGPMCEKNKLDKIKFKQWLDMECKSVQNSGLSVWDKDMQVLHIAGDYSMLRLNRSFLDYIHKLEK